MVCAWINGRSGAGANAEIFLTGLVRELCFRAVFLWGAKFFRRADRQTPGNAL